MSPLSRGKILAALVGSLACFAVAGLAAGPRAVGAMAVLIAMAAVFGGIAAAAWQSLNRAPAGQVRFPLFLAIVVGGGVAGSAIAAAREWERTHNALAPPWAGPLAIVAGVLAGAASGWIVFGARLATERARAALAERARLEGIRDARIARGAEPGQLSDAPADPGAGGLSVPADRGSVSPPRNDRREKA